MYACTRTSVLLATLLMLTPGPLALAADCADTSTGAIPIIDLGAGQYLGQFAGGLYPGGLNVPPQAHFQAARTAAQNIRPLSPAGLPNPAGKYVMLSIGMSNTTQEFCGGATCRPWSFGGQAATDVAVNHTWLEIVDGAAGGQAAPDWESPTHANYVRINNLLQNRGLSEAQVQAAWVKLANRNPTASLPDPSADAFVLLTQLGNISRTLRTRYPNLKIIYLSSRTYGGYAEGTLNPEPFAYESAFGVKWLIEAQIRQAAGQGIDPRAGDLDPTTVAPMLVWGPYLWTDGTTPRSDGLTWDCVDVEADGVHPSPSGEEKVGDLLLDFMLTSPLAAPWFARPDPPLSGDLDGDEDVDLTDLSRLLSDFGCASACAADVDGDGDTDLSDLSQLLANFGR
ncbi:MAG: hypothetical protein ACKVS9_14590 [Phycisphaerae bacterium]